MGSSVQDIKLVQPREERRETLHRSYGFHCGCSQCSLSDAESEASDSRLEDILDLWDEVSDWEANPPPSPAQAETLIELFKAVSRNAYSSLLCDPHPSACLTRDFLLI